MSQSKDDPLVGSIFGLCAGLGLFWFGFHLRRKYKIIERTPTSKVRSLAIGLAEIQGKAEIFKEPLVSPFSQKPCVYYSYTVEQKKRSGKKTRWVTIASGKSESPFFVRDETGVVTVLPEGAECHFDVDNRFRTGLFSSEQEDQFKAGLTRIGVSYQGLFGDKTLRCQETLIAAGDNLYVLAEAQRRAAATDSARNEDNLYMGKGAQKMCIFSDSSEKELLSSLKLQMYLFVYGGPVIALVCLYILLNRLGV